jgi:hypothetical protein
MWTWTWGTVLPKKLVVQMGGLEHLADCGRGSTHLGPETAVLIAPECCPPRCFEDGDDAVGEHVAGV